jgi:hypothetical protein
MNCTEARTGLLEAERSTLEAQDGSPLAHHIAGCPECKARAQAILQGESLLATHLGQGVVLPDLDGIIDAAQVADDGLPLHSRWRQRVSWKRGAALLPLAAAAVLVTVFLRQVPSLPGPEYTPQALSPGLGVEVPEGQSVAVLATTNPDITVLWHF